MSFLSGLLKPSSGDDTYTRLRLRFIQAMAVFTVGASALGVVAQIVSANTNSRGLIIASVVLMCGVGLLFVARRRLLDLASILLVLIFTISTLFSGAAFVLIAALALVSAATLTSVPVYIAANVAVFGHYIYHLVQTPLTPDGRNSPEGALGLAIMSALIVVSSTMRYFVDEARRAVKLSIRNTSLLQISADISHAISSILDLQQLLDRAAELIRDRFGVYHVQIYLIDKAGDDAVLIAATGDEGRQLLDYKFRVSLKERRAVAQVAHLRQPVIVRDTDPNFQRNPLLPSTRIEAGFPILEGSAALGVLSIHSNRYNALSVEETQALQTLSALLATAIRNARLFEAQNQAMHEQRRLFIEAEANLREIQRLNQQLTHRSWEDYLSSVRAVGGVTLRDDTLEHEIAWTETLAEASSTRQPVIQQNGTEGTAVVAVPVLLRGEVIGAIEVEAEQGAPSSAAVEMVEAVAQRLALSLDNARLFEETQAAAFQEQRINQIAARYQEAASVDELLGITLTELSQVLGARRGAIRLGIVPQNAGNGGAAS